MWIIQPLRYIRHYILETVRDIEAWFQTTANRKWSMTIVESNGHVTDDVMWPDRSSRDPIIRLDLEPNLLLDNSYRFTSI